MDCVQFLHCVAAFARHTSWHSQDTVPPPLVQVADCSSVIHSTSTTSYAHEGTNMALTVASTWSSRRKTHLGSGLNRSSVDFGLELEQVLPLHLDDETFLSKTQPAILKT